MSNNTTTWVANENDTCMDSLLDEPFVKVPVMTIYILVFLLCLIGNLLTILVMTTHPRMRTATNFFLANLAVADLLVAVFCILQNMTHIIGFDHGNWPFGYLLCKLYLGLTNIMPCTSAGILVLVSIEKYIAVLHPLSGLKWLTPEHRMIATAGVWVLSISINLPYILYADFLQLDEMAACFRSPMPLWNAFSFVVWYLIPLTALVFIYSRISHLLWTSDSRQSSRQSNESSTMLTSSATTAGSSWQLKNGRIVVYKQESLLNVPNSAPEQVQNKKKSKETEGRRKVIRLLVAVVVSFAVLTFPHHARLLYTSFNTGSFCMSDWTVLAQPFSYIFLFFSSAINPILYACLSKRFRNAMSDLLHCRKGAFSRISRSRNRTLVSDVPEDSRCPSPVPAIRMNRLRT